MARAVMDLPDAAHASLVDQCLGMVHCRGPVRGPVDHQANAVAGRGARHLFGNRQRRRHRFLFHDMDAALGGFRNHGERPQVVGAGDDRLGLALVVQLGGASEGRNVRIHRRKVGLKLGIDAGEPDHVSCWAGQRALQQPAKVKMFRTHETESYSPFSHRASTLLSLNAHRVDQ